MHKHNSFRREVLVFRRFGRKGYCIFASLGREVVIGTLSVFTLTHARADGVSIKPLPSDTVAAACGLEVRLGDVSVTGSMAPPASGRTVRMVSVLTQADIESAPAQSVNDLLKLAAGVDVRQRGPLGAQADVSIRGGNYEQVAVLLDGINICDPQTGHNAFDFPVDISEIERNCGSGFRKEDIIPELQNLRLSDSMPYLLQPELSKIPPKSGMTLR